MYIYLSNRAILFASSNFKANMLRLEVIIIRHAIPSTYRMHCCIDERIEKRQRNSNSNSNSISIDKREVKGPFLTRFPEYYGEEKKHFLLFRGENRAWILLLTYIILCFKCFKCCVQMLFQIIDTLRFILLIITCNFSQAVRLTITMSIKIQKCTVCRRSFVHVHIVSIL